MPLDRISDVAKATATQLAGETQLIFDQIEARISPKCLQADQASVVTALAAINDLSWTVVSGKIYTFSLILRVNDNNAEGIKLALDGGSATVSVVWASFFGFDNAPGTMMAHTAALATVAAADGFAGVGLIEVRGSFTTSGAGTFQPRFAQKTHVTGTLTLLKGSSLIVREAAA